MVGFWITPLWQAPAFSSWPQQAVNTRPAWQGFQQPAWDWSNALQLQPFSFNRFATAQQPQIVTADRDPWGRVIR
jgi:hypothetical protein